MPSKTRKQQRFFQAVRAAKHNPDAPAHLRQVANSMPDSDLNAFADKVVKELKMKKAMLGILKDVREQIDIQEPMYLDEVSGEEQASIDPIADEFQVQENWAKYINPYIGQPLSEKELESLVNFKDKQPININKGGRMVEIWYKSKDTMGITHTTVIRKMKDSGQFSYISFQKQKSPESPEDKTNQEMNAGSAPPDLGGQPEIGGFGGSPEQSQEPQPGASMPTPAQQQKEKEKTEGKETIIVTKSIPFKDDIKGAAILIEFLKKLNL